MVSKDKHIHIVSFDVPYPPSYGGVIDVYYKIKALYQKGIKVHLHCFQYGRDRSPALNQFCESVHYYRRNAAKSQLFRKLPYIVLSRSSDQLLHNLLKDDHPIIFEGLHTCILLADERLRERIKVVRTHNIEHDYYQSLARIETNIFKRYYFYNEAGKLEQFESILSKAQIIAAISRNDDTYFRNKYEHSFYIPAFHSQDQVNIIPGKGSFAFYHGNLAIGENNEAALYLVNEVFSEIDIPLIIAGSKPSRDLRLAVVKKNNVTLLSDLGTRQIHQLIKDAQVNVLPTFQPTGIKLKLLSALYNGRHTLVNNMMVENTGLESLCTIADHPEEMREKLKQLMQKEFTPSEIQNREKILNGNFSNSVNAQKLLNLIFKD